MNLNHLKDRLRKETDVERFIGEEGVDYRVSSIRTRRTQRANLRSGQMVIMGGKPPSKDELLNKVEEKKDKIGIFKIEFIVDNNDKAEWIASQVGEEIKHLPYILRERKMERDADNEDEAIYVGEYAVDKNWIEE